jgi:hypothetical protein
MPALRKFDYDECQRLKALDPQYWTRGRLAQHFGVSGRSIYRALHPENEEAYSKERKHETYARWYDRHRPARRLAQRCGIPIARARVILEAQAQHLSREARP